MDREAGALDESRETDNATNQITPKVQEKKEAKSDSKILKPSSWTRINGKRVGLGGKAYILIDGEKIEIPQATADELKALSERGKV